MLRSRRDRPRPVRTALVVMDFQPGIIARVTDGDALVERVRAPHTPCAPPAPPSPGSGSASARRTSPQCLRPRRCAPRWAVTATAWLPTPRRPSTTRDSRPPRGRSRCASPASARSRAPTWTRSCARGVDTLVLAGIAISGAVLSTARDGADRDYQQFVLADGCAPRSAVHEFLCTEILSRQCTMLTVDQLESALAG